jgi:NAD(P)-dependent dehydrogenase (short-subunit alcohol dehydrogenase family)
MTSLIDFKLAGCRALVSGGASGIGLATAERLARSGAHVALNDIASGKLQMQVDRLGRDGLKVYAIAGDLSDSAAAAAVARRSLDWLGGLDYLVNPRSRSHAWENPRIMPTS